MTTGIDAALRREIEACLEDSNLGDGRVRSILERVERACRDVELEELSADRLGLDSDVAPAVDVRPQAGFDLDRLPDLVFITDDDGVIQDCRGGSPRDLVMPRAGLVGKSIARAPGRKVTAGFRAAMEAARNGADPATFTYTLKHEAGAARYEARLSRTRDGQFIVVVRNTHRTELDAAAAHDKLSMLEATFDATADGILVVDSAGNYVTSNRIFHEMCRIPRHMLYRGQEMAVARFVLRLLKKPEIVLEKAMTIQNSVSTRTRDVIQFHDGRVVECVSMPKWIDGKRVGRVWSFRDITDRVRAEQRTRFNAYHDSLTRLPNRALFQDRLAQAVARARRSDGLTALLLLDLDRFKTINDTLGHAAGDKLLAEVATRLQSRKREGDTIARLGGDEFVLVVADLRSREDAAVIAEQLIDVLKPPILIDDHELHVSASIGIAVAPEDGEEGTTLLKSADLALYRAKELGRDSYHIFEPKLNERVMQRLVLEKDLRRAIHDQEFVLMFQPQYHLESGRMRGVEALVRWRQGEEIVSPAKFIPIAEECGLIVPLGSWVLRESIRHCAKFHEVCGSNFRVCVNVSAMQIQRPNFATEVAKVLEQHGLPPTQLVLELTERTLMQNPEQGSYAMEQLQRMGIGIAMDDFGTGHSSLNYVSVLPISMIKIDRGFVMNCAKRKTDTAILSAIVTMGHALGLKVLAEGVETAEQVRVLRAQRCDEVQGHYFSRPVYSEQIVALLESEAKAG
jgi:diguanylate cyclase (GGDEF)-like protein/PAS domain S-box-containing protein